VLYIDRNFDIRETVGPYDKYLNLPRRQLHLNLLRMVPSDISVLLSAEIRKAEKSGEKIHLRNVRFKKDEGASALELFIRPGGPGTNNAFTMIMLRESILDDHSGNGNGNGNGHSNGHSNGHGNGAADFRGREEEYVRMLESELNEVRSHLQLAIEDLETTNEELQSTNEELLSANEELQSSNEELQSLNEELITLNTEHQLKIKELLDLNDDLNNYFRSTDIAQVFLDADLRIRRFNPASANMINFIDSDLGRPLTHISNNIRSETLLADVQTVLNTGRALEKEIQLLNGRDFLMRIMPYLHHDGKKDGVIIAFVDIAERKLAEEKIAERTAQLQHLNEALEISNHDLQQFASIASHDLQEPLRKIHMYSTEIQERYGNQLPENVRGYFEKITRCTSRMRTLIIDILNYSRLSAEVPVFKRTDLQAMFNEIVEDFEVAIREKHATVTASPLPEIDLIPGQFRQVLHNLLSNALKFSRPGTPPVITLRAERIRLKSFDSPPDPAGNYYRLTLTDNGIGFEEKFADDVFKLFHRLHSKDRFEGSGIGLAITKKIIERHNGLITTSSSEGIGTRFEMVLPLNH
jgi:signal transduction histidine kinase